MSDEFGFGNPQIVEEEVDILIIGGGMAACGAGFEVMRWVAEAAKHGVELKVKLVDKATMDRSGAVAQGLSAINTYMGDNDPSDYVRYVRQDLMGIVREDLVYDVGRHVDDSVHNFEKWGLPIWKQPGDENTPLAEGGKPVRTGRWQVMINGESYKWIVAEAAKKALGLRNIEEHVFITRLVTDGNDPSRIAGAAGFSVRDHQLHDAGGDQAPGGRGVGGLPRHDHRPVRRVGGREHRARQGDVGADADRALPARKPRGLCRHLVLGPRGHSGHPGPLPLGLQPHDDGERPLHRRRRRVRAKPLRKRSTARCETSCDTRTTPPPST